MKTSLSGRFRVDVSAFLITTKRLPSEWRSKLWLFAQSRTDSDLHDFAARLQQSPALTNPHSASCAFPEFVLDSCLVCSIGRSGRFNSC